MNDAKKFIYKHNNSASTVKIYIKQLAICGFIKIVAHYPPTYIKNKNIPLFLTTTKLREWTNVKDDVRQQLITSYIRLYIIKKLLTK